MYEDAIVHTLVSNAAHVSGSDSLTFSAQIAVMVSGCGPEVDCPMTALIAVIYYPAIIPAYGRGRSGLYLPLLPRPLRDPLTSETLNEQGLVIIRPREKTAGEIIAGMYSDKFGTDIQQTRFFLDTRVGPPLSRDSLVLS